MYFRYFLSLVRYRHPRLSYFVPSTLKDNKNAKNVFFVYSILGTSLLLTYLTYPNKHQILQKRMIN